MQFLFNDEVDALILMSSLLDSWATTITAVSSFVRNNKLKLDDIHNLILSEDVRMRDLGEPFSPTFSSTLNIESRERSIQKGMNQGIGILKFKGKGQTEVQNDIISRNCDKRDHFTHQCKAPKKKKNNKNKRYDDYESTNTTIDEFINALFCSLDSLVDSWVMDLGASFHTNTSIEHLSHYVSGKFENVYLVDHRFLDITGRCDIDIKTYNWNVWTLYNIIHIPTLKRNLISIGQLDDDGHYTTFRDRT